MERRKNLLPTWLVVAPIMLGTAFVFWSFLFAVVTTTGTPAEGQSTPRVKPSSRVCTTQARTTRPSYKPLAPRLLPHAETCLRRASRPSIPMRASQSSGLMRENPLRKSVHPATFPLPAENAETSVQADAPVGEPSVTPRQLPVKAVPVKAVQTQRVQPQTANPQTPPQTPSVKESGPRYSWLLEGQAGMPADSSCRSFQLERIARQADILTRHGFSLANRGAYYSARAEFVKALRLVAQGLDVEHQTSVHGRALHAGLAALEEADDFIPSGSQLETDLDFQAIINAHRTPVLKLSQPRTLTSLEALRRYFGFAQYQLAIASGREVAGSMALHAMAKLYASSIDNSSVNVLSAKPKAMTYFQAAMICYPQNYMASNDLGVLLANSGRLEDARKILESSVEICPHSASWRNLAVVYRQLDLPELARRAQQNQQLSRQREVARRESVSPGATDPRVSWLLPEEFSKTYAQAADARRPLPLQQAPAMAQTRQSAKTRAQAKPEQPSADNPVIESRRTTSWSWNILKKAFK